MTVPNEGAAERGGAMQEVAASRNGPPDLADATAIAGLMLSAMGGRPGAPTKDEAENLARTLVGHASVGIRSLGGGMPAWGLSIEEALGLEAVIHVRGRPAVRVLGDDLEDMSVYPGAEVWRAAYDLHREIVIAACTATGAVCVRDAFMPEHPWVQGTAWLISADLAVTNRHVLFPPVNGTPLARRLPGTATAQMKSSYVTTLDFAFDNGVAREAKYRVKGVPFVSGERDPLDVAVLEVQRLSGPKIDPLTVSSKTAFDLERLFVVGHPGRPAMLPEKVRAVFGEPDEKKRVSFGQMFDVQTMDPDEVLHDASTIGGFSGAPVLGLLQSEVRALHYWGDQEEGNRAITASALRRNEALKLIFDEAARCR